MWNSKESFNNNLKRNLKKLYRTFEKEPQCAIYVDRLSKIGTYNKHDLTFAAAHQMEIFAQEFKPASYFCDWTCVHLIMSWQKSPKFDFQSQFSMSKISFIILVFVSVKIIRLGVQLMINQFLINSVFPPSA